MSDPLEAGKTPPAAPAPAPVAAPAAPAAPVAPAEIDLATFQQIALRVATITAAELHPKADRLLVLTVDIGEAAPRQVVAGIRANYQPEELIGKQVVVVANLKPAALRGVTSQGMVLAGSDESGLAVLHPGRPLKPGSIVK